MTVLHLELGTVLVVEPPEDVLLYVNVVAVRGDNLPMFPPVTHHADCGVSLVNFNTALH